MDRLPTVLEPLRDSPDSSALFADFDGTLAPIVPDPASARPLPGVAETLSALGHHLGLVAVVSGRPALFLAEVLGRPEAVRLEGLYGMEEIGSDGEVRTAPDAEPWRATMSEVFRKAEREAPTGIGVEPKGLTLTLHWRQRPDQESWVREFCEQAAASSGLVAKPARMSLELFPPVAQDKGGVVLRLGEGRRAVAYLGDDLGDLPAFAALDSLGGDGVSVAKVAVTDPESAPAVAASADVVVEGPAGALALLRTLLGPTAPASR